MESENPEDFQKLFMQKILEAAQSKDYTSKQSGIEDIINENSLENNMQSQNYPPSQSKEEEIINDDEHLRDSFEQPSELTQNDVLELSNTFNLSKEAISDNIEIPKFKLPIEFINYMEKDYIKHQIEESKETSQLSNYKDTPNFQFNVMKFIEKNSLSQKFFKDQNIIISLCAKEDFIFTGTKEGKIGIYSCSKGIEMKSISSDKLFDSNEKDIICMDASEDVKYLVTGYKNGFLALWDLNNYQCKKLLNEVHKASVINVKFYKTSEGYYEFFSADMQGTVNKTTITEYFIRTSVNVQKILQYKNPVFLLELLIFTQEEIDLYDFGNYAPVIYCFGFVEYVLVYQIEPWPKNLLRVIYPKYLRKEKNTKFYIPDVGFGRGYIPQGYEPSFEVNKSKPQLLLAISWERIVYLYHITITPEKQGGNIIEIGHYIHTTEILRMGFITTTIIFIIDKNKNIVLLNTRFITPGELKFDPLTGEPRVQKLIGQKPELEIKKEIDSDLQYQLYIPNKYTGTNVETYNNMIVFQNKRIYILGKKDLHYAEFLNWEQCLNNLKQESNWMNALTLGIEIFHGRIMSLSEIPFNKSERKKRSRGIIKDILKEYVTRNMSNDVQIDKKRYNELLGRCINISIESCIEINNTDYLFSQIQTNFDSKGYNDMFFEKLESFILCDKIKKIDKDTLEKIIKRYEDNKKFQILSQVISRLDIDCIDEDRIRILCNDHKLITPLFIIYTEGQENDFIEPLQKCFKMFVEDKTTSYIPYSSIVSRKTLLNILKTKQYYGHKLLWLIDLCLSGKKFSNQTEISQSKMEEIIPQIVVWMINENILKSLIDFDSFSLFKLFTRLFTEERLYNIISKKFEKKSDNKKKEEKKENNCDIIAIINYIIEQANSFKSKFILEDLNRFILNIGHKIPRIYNDIIIDAFKFFFEEKEDNKNQIKEVDCFNIYKNKDKNRDEYNVEITRLIKNILEHWNDLFSKDEMLHILNLSLKSDYIQIQIYLYNLLEKYTECLDLYLSEKNTNNKNNQIFHFINKTFIELEKKDEKYQLEEFKNGVLLNISRLSKLSVSDLFYLTDKWFNSNYCLILEKIEDSKPQLEYLETILSTYKEDELSSQKELETYLYYLTAHINLLCLVGKTNEILPNLKKRQAYPIQECIQKCLEYKVEDAVIYLYLSTGAIHEALKYSISILENDFSQILDLLKNKDLSSIDKQIEEYQEDMKRSIKICDDGSILIGYKDSDIWFSLLTTLYELTRKINEKKESLGESEEAKEYTRLKNILSDEIEEFLNKMYSHVKIRVILDFVTEKYKHAEFKEFKNILLSMLSSNSYMQNILECAKSLITRFIINGESELCYGNYKGNHYLFDSCNECKEKFKKDKKESITLFRCGHLLHKKCCIIDGNAKICQVCRKKEIDELITSSELTIKKEEEKEEDQKKKRLSSVFVPKKTRIDKEATFSKLSHIDDHFNEANSYINI